MKVSVLMSTYNGEKYLEEQIKSIINQKGVDVFLTIRDDGSRDNTRNILDKYSKINNIKVIFGENIGYRKSFLWLLDNSGVADFYAFADQDDIWEKNKIKVAINKLNLYNNSKGKLYTSALKCVDKDLNYMHTQSFKGLKLTFYSEFVRHRFAGCTYVFDNNLREKCLGASEISGLEYGHDAFVCLMCWLSGGLVIYDPNSYILFRRHGNNTSVDGMGIKKRFEKEFAFLNKKKNNKLQVVRIIQNYYNQNIDEKYESFIQLVTTYRDSFYKRIKLAFDRRLDCGMISANIIFRISILLGCM